MGSIKSAATLFLVAFLCIGCQGQGLGATETGALGGGALGAGLGAIIGNQVGSTGAGIAIGGAMGALTGGLIGNQIDATDKSITERDQRISAQERELQENRRLIEELKASGLDVRTTDRGVVVNLPDVLFQFGSARLTEHARNSVSEIARVIKSHEGRKVSVEGHTDSVGTVQYNLTLSEDRARSVADGLANSGVNRRKLSVRGFGESRPITSNNTESGRSRNRRVEVIIEN